MTEQSDLITMISIDDGENEENKTEDSTPYLMEYTGKLEELFISITLCSQWPAESEVKLYYNAIPRIAMMDMKGNKIRPEIDHKWDLLVFTPTTEFLGKSHITGFSVTFAGQPKKFTLLIEKIIRFISKVKMTQHDFSAVHSFIGDIKQFNDWRKYGFFFPITIV